MDPISEGAHRPQAPCSNRASDNGPPRNSGRFAEHLTDRRGGASPRIRRKLGSNLGVSIAQRPGKDRSERELSVNLVARDSTKGRRHGRESADRRDGNDEASVPFQLPNPALIAPIGPAEVPTHQVASEQVRAAVLVERLLKSLRVGKTHQNGHEIRLQLRRNRGEAPLEIRLEECDGRISATVRCSEGGRVAAEKLSRALEEELQRRGVQPEFVRSVVDGS